MNDADLPLLLHFNISHYNEKVRWALDHKRWPHRREALVPGLHIPRARWFSGQNKLPVIRIDGRVIAGSGHILEEIERLRPDPPLFPRDAAGRERALSIQKHFDDDVAPELRRLFWQCYVPHPMMAARMACDGAGAGTRLLWRTLFPVLLPVFSGNLGLDRDTLARAHRRLPEHFDRLEAEIQPSGYLVGDRFSVADLSAAAVMTAIVRPPQFPDPLPEPWPEELVALRRSVEHRRGFRWVLDVYAQHRDASCEVA